MNGTLVSVNPPVHAWATWEIYTRDRGIKEGAGDIDFLKYAFSKLAINFTWWVNRKDEGGNNLFQGGFLGLDNIGVFDRSATLPTGGHLEQADGTAWMVFFSQRMFQIAIELALHDPLYEDFAIKFFKHTMWIAGAMDRLGEHHDELWDEEDGYLLRCTAPARWQFHSLKSAKSCGFIIANVSCRLPG